jgi:hypothetical protein
MAKNQGVTRLELLLTEPNPGPAGYEMNATAKFRASDGSPEVDAQIQFFHNGDPVATQQTDANGSASITMDDLKPGMAHTIRIEATGTSWTKQETKRIATESKPKPPEPAKFVLRQSPSGETIHGTVLTKDDAPVARIGVEISDPKVGQVSTTTNDNGVFTYTFTFGANETNRPLHFRAGACEASKTAYKS